ncbi:MAG TPA: asparagine synthase (glutamine-hydrolyzing) [Burkholderiales bacterium]|nr:asparagine synthase (glutamine-hydrolyzing) [Burkholderiales bacterium]
MCGIAGLFDLNASPRDCDPASTASKMVSALAHRGPDGHGSWGEAELGIGLGHRRLAIIDLSPTGAQPMRSAHHRFVLIHNGEVYNFQELRHELEQRGRKFRGSSDTEVMLEAFDVWGVAEATQRFVGMFAFAVFDRREQTLYLVRDRLGIKPLYWSANDRNLLFGSELRALMAHPSFRKDVDREAVAAFLRYSYVPGPNTIFVGVQKLPPGCILVAKRGTKPQLTQYWRLRDTVTQPTHTDITPEEAKSHLHDLLARAVRDRLVADVPLGAFLSGGIDSSAVVSLMQACSKQATRTFTIGFEKSIYDESAFARDVAKRLGTDHTEVILDPQGAIDLVPEVAEWFDEPFADSSQLPTYLVSRMTRQHVTVALSGDGGDEVFGGYPKYELLARHWNRLGRLPRALRVAGAEILSALPERALVLAGRAALDSSRTERLSEKARRLARALAAEDFDTAAEAISLVGIDGKMLVPGAQGLLRSQMIPELATDLPDPISRMQAQDMAGYLPDDILTKVDRCSMAVGLEARVPLLDHRIVEFVCSLPIDIRRGNQPKALLRAVLTDYLPPELINRPKRGFQIPLGDWLSGPLRAWAENLLGRASNPADAFLDSNAVGDLWRQHVSGRRQSPTSLWNVLMLRAWAERWLK